MTSAPKNNWSAVASSADGTKLVAAAFEIYNYNTHTNVGGPIYTSADSGETWIESNAPITNWSAVTSSADGSKFAALVYGSSIYTSGNSGAAWVATSAPTNNWTSIAASANGTKLVTTTDSYYGDGEVYTSTNSGESWSVTTAPRTNWQTVASSADGSKLVAAAWGSGIYISTDSGATWMQTTAPENGWRLVASSGDGNRLAATGGGPICISTNSGDSWTQTTAPTEDGVTWSSLTISANGTKLVVMGSSYNIGPAAAYISTDSGTTWTQADFPAGSAYWRVSAAASADGNQLVAAANSGGFIYTLQFPLPPSPSLPAPRLSISPAGANLTLAWLVPSTSFVLQQNVDLSTSNWTDVLTLPTLNLTNLHYQATVSPPNGRGFFRFMQQ